MLHLTFCRDGILRESVRYRDRASGAHVFLKVPVLATQCHDPHSFLKKLNATVTLEDGLTVAELFANLKPWADTMIGVACMDFPAFVAESEKPAVKGEDDLSHIAITYYASLNAVSAYEERSFADMFEKAEKGFSVFKPGTPQVSDRLEVETRWSSHAVYRETQTDEHGNTYRTCSIDHSPVDTWAHLPIVIESQAIFCDETPHSKRFLSSRQEISRPDHPLATRIDGLSGEPFRLEYPMEAALPTFYETIVLGFLWNVGFHYSPVGRDQAVEEIRQAADEVEAMLADKPHERTDEETLEALEAARHDFEKARALEMVAAARSLGLSVITDTTED